MATGENGQINPWTHLWGHPRETGRFLMDTYPTRWVIWLAIVGGIFSAVSFLGSLWTQYPHQEEFHHTVFLVLSCVAGAVLGLVNLYFISWLYKMTGSWVRGQGTFVNVKCAVGWSNYPFILAAIFSILAFFSNTHPWLQFIFSLCYFALLIWGFIIFLLLLAEAHGFSIWRALWTVLIAAVLIFVVLMIIALLIPLLSPLFE